MIACSVIVPTRRRAELLGRCLHALARQTTPRGVYEIIVADDAGTAGDEATKAQVCRLSDGGLPVRYVAAGARGPAAARNTGARLAAGSLLAFTDDDTIPDARWLERAQAAFHAKSALDAAHGRVLVPLPEQPTDYERDAAGLEHAGFVTANCFVRASAFWGIGGFDDAFTAAWREDSDLYFRLLAAGRCVEPIPDAIVVHPVRPARWGVSLQQQGKGRFDALLFKKHPILFAQHVRPGRGGPTLYYPAVAALGLVAAGLMRGWTALALAAAATWIALTGMFAAQRLRGTSRALRHLAEMAVTSALIPPLSLFWRVQGAVRHRVLFW